MPPKFTEIVRLCTSVDISDLGLLDLGREGQTFWGGLLLLRLETYPVPGAMLRLYIHNFMNYLNSFK